MRQSAELEVLSQMPGFNELRQGCIRQMAKILCPEKSEGSIGAMFDGIITASNHEVTKSILNLVYYKPTSFLHNQMHDHVTPVRSLIEKTIANEEDDESRSQLQTIYDSIQWEFFIKPDAATLAKWKQKFQISDQNDETTKTTTLPAIRPHAAAKDSTTQDLATSSFPVNFRGIVIQNGGSAAMIQPGENETVQIKRTKNGYTITLENGNENGG